MSDNDELAEINEIKPNVHLQDGVEQDVESASRYKVKRTWDHYYCTCPAWRNQGGVPVNVRKRKHLKSLLAEKYEEARMKLKNPDGPPPSKGKAPVSKKKPASKAKSTAGKKRKKLVDEDDGDGDQAEEARYEKPNTKKTKNVPAPRSKGNTAVKEADDHEEMEDEQTREDERKEGAKSSDELAKINGIKPNIYLEDGAEKEVSSMSSSSTYKVKRIWDHYYCTCPAWRNQGGVPIDARSCKHLKSLLGEKYEEARMKFKNPDGPPAKGKPVSKATAKKRKKVDNEEEDDEDAGKGEGAPALLLANKWDLEKGADPTGWWISEKLDGVRTFYDGKRMISRLGNPFTPPQWFLDKLPTDVTLDGELFSGRGEFQSTVSIVKTVNSPHWKGVTFQIFDIPSRGTSTFEDRVSFLKGLFGPEGSHACAEVVLVEYEKAKDRQHVLDKLKEIETVGGEGLMLRKPGSLYEGHRSASLLKIKTFYDAEARVTGYVPGKGRLAGMTGALKCEMELGKKFNVGTGLSDKQRKKPPKIGAIVTYRFQELTRDGVPRFPSYIGEPIDKDEPKDAEIPEHRKPGAKPVLASE